jgi:plastocyanin
LLLPRAASAAAVLLGATVSPTFGENSIATHTVTIENMQFSPRTLAVHRGERIVWVNKDLFPHTVTTKGAFDSGAISAASSWTYVADRVGEYTYTCTFHPTMSGVLKVIEK